MTFANEPLKIVGGSDVVGSDGEKFGTVDRVEGQYIVVKKGWFFPKDTYIPESAVASANDEVVTLNVTKDVALEQEWDAEPADTASETAAAAPATGDGLGKDPASLTVPLSEEELTATRRGVDRGAVRVEKEVIAKEQTLDVPVTEEHVTVNRRIVDRDVAPGDTAFEAGEFEVPVHGEEVDVQKRARVREELEVSREAVEETEHVTDTVRREEAHVTDTTDAGRRNDTDGNRR